MISLFLCFSASIVIQYSDVDKSLEIAQTGPTFLIACSSEDFEYSTLSRSFVRSAHLSTINANFVVVDVSGDSEAASKLEVRQFPCVMYVKGGKVVRTQYRGFDEEFLVAFFNTNFIGDIPVISTQEELDKFYKFTAIGMIVAFEGATQEKFPEVYSFYCDNFYDTSVVFADPSLFPTAGFYLYRYLDSSLVQLPDLSKAGLPEITNAINDASFPEFPKINSYIAGEYEKHRQLFVILMLAMDEFYLSQEQLDLARAIKSKLNISVAYSDIENSQFVGMSYGLPDSLDSTLAVIDARKDRLFKYMLPTELTEENAIACIESVLDGEAKPFWRSEIDPVPAKDTLQVVTANILTQLIKDKKDAIIAIYYSNQEPIQPYVNATAAHVKDPKGVIYGKYSLGLNDWSGPTIGDELPFIVRFKDGKAVYAKKLEETTEAVAKQIEAALASNDEL